LARKAKLFREELGKARSERGNGRGGRNLSAGKWHSLTSEDWGFDRIPEGRERGVKRRPTGERVPRKKDKFEAKGKVRRLANWEEITHRIKVLYQEGEGRGKRTCD